MKLIKRDLYLDRLINVIGTPDIKVITGVRRSGKSKLLESLITYLNKGSSNNNIIHINFSLSKFDNLLNDKSLEEYIESQYKREYNNFVMIDEVQMCQGFEKAINSMHASEKYDIYITGSNAFLLSSDLATLFTGRTFEIDIYPFSFFEYLQYFAEGDIQKAFEDYFYIGGMAGSYLYKEEEDKGKYLKDIFSTLIIRDIIKKYKIRNKILIEYLSSFLMSNISNITSIRNIAATLTSNSMNVNDKTIASYIKYLCNAFAFYEVKRYDIRGKRYLRSSSKYYLCDHSFRYATLGKKELDFGRVYENIVAIELLRRGYDLYVGNLYQKEIDFVAMKRNEKLYIQVADNISDANTFAREIAPLLMIKDAYPKIVIARTRHDMYIHEGIEVFDIAEWLYNI